MVFLIFRSILGLIRSYIQREYTSLLWAVDISENKRANTRIYIYTGSTTLTKIDQSRLRKLSIQIEILIF
jgi:hypothetical protein